MRFAVMPLSQSRMLAMSLLVLLCCGFAWSAQAGERLINIKVAQYDRTIEFTAPRGTVWDLGGKTGRLAAQQVAQINGTLEKKAKKRYHVMVASVSLTEPERLEQVVAEWRALGFEVRTSTLGQIFYSEDGKTVLYDNRVADVEVGVYDDYADAQAHVDKLAAQGKSSWIRTEIVSMAQGKLTLSAGGETLAEGSELALVPETTILLKKVEYAVGYPWHGFADRTYRGNMVCRWGAQDAIDCVLSSPLETVLAGVVPSEISAKAEIGALQAQACAARGEILSKIGIRHAGEGFDTCSEQHCQVFSGESALSLDMEKKIAPTCGYVLTNSAGSLVDAVYAANCGGRGESNHYVWTTQPNPILRGVWDISPEPSLDLTEEEQCRAFINNPPAAYCNNPAVEGGTNFRWKKSISTTEWKSIESAVGVGRIKSITDIARGLSGRMYRLTFVGERGNKTVMKELNIRKLFGGLKSSCFVADWKKDAAGFIVSAELSGAGFGHGVGMCQTGAQALAKKGWSFDRILAHYFPGSVLKKLY